MKKILLIMTVLFLLYPSALSALHAKETTKTQIAEVIADKADIFLEASQHSIVIDTIVKGTTVTLFPSGKKNKKWLYISYLSRTRGSQVTGFVDSLQVEIIKENAPDEPAVLQNTALPVPEEAMADPEEKETQKSQKESEELRSLLEEMEKEKQVQPEKAQDIDAKNREDDAQQKRPESRQDVINEEKVTQEEKKPEPTVMAEQENIEEHEEAARGAKSGNNESSAQEQENHKEASTEEATIEKTKKTEEEPLPKVLTKVSVKVPRANIRLMPTTQSTIIQQVRSGTELKHLAKTGNWHRVNLDPNEEGFVLSGYIHQSIVNEVYETLAPPPDPEKKPETEPEVIEEKTEPEPEPEPVQEIPTLRKKSLGKYYWVGGGAGYTMPSESNFEKGVNFGGTFGLGITKHLAFELRVPYFQSDVMGTADGLSSGRLSSLSLMLSIQGRYPIKNRFIPYLVVGGDYHLNTFSINEEIAQAWNQLGFNIEESVDHTFGLHLGAGLDVFLMHNIALTVDVLYYTTNLTGKRTLANQISQEMTSGAINNMKFNSLQAALSVKLFFNPLGRKQ